MNNWLDTPDEEAARASWPDLFVAWRGGLSARRAARAVRREHRRDARLLRRINRRITRW